MSTRSHDRARTTIWVVVLGGMLLIAILFAPRAEDPLAGPRLTTFSQERSGARGLYETAARLGWQPARHVEPDLPADDGTIVYAVLAPSQPLTALEVAALLERVRSGAGLLTVAEARTPMAESLGVRRSRSLGVVPEDTTADCPRDRRERLAETLRGAVFANGLELTRGGPEDTTTLLNLATAQDPQTPTPTPAVVGFVLGRGRVAVVSDPVILTNNVVRRCRLQAGVTAMQALAYVSAGSDTEPPRTRLLFDEFHHGYGAQPSVVRTAARFVRDHPVGRMLGHASLAGVLVLAALAFRPAPAGLPPAMSRRSPLEHVHALALAYSQVPATRTATGLLVRGLRRRLHRLGIPGQTAAGDDEFLRELAGRFPGLTAQIATVRHALATRVPARDFPRVGRSITTIESTISGSQ